jgi:hypothetical protein
MEVVVGEDGSVERVRLVSAARRMTDMMLLSGASRGDSHPRCATGNPSATGSLSTGRRANSRSQTGGRALALGAVCRLRLNGLHFQRMSTHGSRPFERSCR